MNSQAANATPRRQDRERRLGRWPEHQVVSPGHAGPRCWRHGGRRGGSGPFRHPVRLLPLAGPDSTWPASRRTRPTRAGHGRGRSPAAAPPAAAGPAPPGTARSSRTALFCPASTASPALGPERSDRPPAPPRPVPAPRPIVPLAGRRPARSGAATAPGAGRRHGRAARPDRSEPAAALRPGSPTTGSGSPVSPVRGRPALGLRPPPLPAAPPGRPVGLPDRSRRRRTPIRPAARSRPPAAVAAAVAARCRALGASGSSRAAHRALPGRCRRPDPDPGRGWGSPGPAARPARRGPGRVGHGRCRGPAPPAAPPPPAAAIATAARRAMDRRGSAVRGPPLPPLPAPPAGRSAIGA